MIFYYQKVYFVKLKKNYEIDKQNNIFNNLLFKFNLLNQRANAIYYFKVINIKYNYSFKYKIAKIEYNIGCYDEKENLICPSDISLNYNISLLCNIEIKFYNISIDSLSGVKKNRYFNCIEFININEKVNFGVKIYDINKNIEYIYINLFEDTLFNYNIIKFNEDYKFDYLIINNEYSSLQNVNNNEAYKLKKSYILYPLLSLKRSHLQKESKWAFENIMNNYFCFCKGQNCLESFINQDCKFFFYVHIIDRSRDLYLKTDYLFVDFIFTEFSSDDVYPIFEKMEKQNYPVHYITEKKDIYEKYCNKTNKCLTIIPITRKNYNNNGDFLQKYLTLMLKLKVFLSGKYNCYDTITYLFYNIEYITYIAIGHGVCYFKDYLFKNNRLYGSKRNDKILIPPSKKLLLVAKRYGWKDENIIKMNLPRWDKYNNDISINTKNNNKFRINSIFLMFTWRNIKKNQKISQYYINNIISLLLNSDLRMALKQNNITLYFTFHRLIREKYKNKFGNTFSNNQYINYIEQNEISNCLSKASLVITDFSSIIFDFMYRKKPFIMFIPDADDPNIRRIYLEEYYELIESLKNGTIFFENIFFEINSVVEKIIFYIKNNFSVEKQLSKFYDSFEINQGPNIKNFIN
jgi:hypothetical protein